MVSVLAVETSWRGKDGAEMVLVPEGDFIMGSGEGKPEEMPPHVVHLRAYYIDQAEVTRKQYAQYLAETGAPHPLNWAVDPKDTRHDQDPVTDVSWFDAMRYAAWAGKRLPTEAEWEKAARGTDGRRFPWGEVDAASVRDVESAEGLQPVGQYPGGASPYGCLDMAGNAWEWTADWFDAYPGSAVRSVHFGQQYKVIRGGGAIQFYGVENSARCTARARLAPYGDYDTLGFRCVRDLDPHLTPYEPGQRIDEAQRFLQASLHPPVTLTYEKEFARDLDEGRVPLTIVGAKGQSGWVRTGVPFSAGAIKDIKSLRIHGSDGYARPTQTAVLATWDDGSPRWVLIDFFAKAGERCELRFNQSDVAPVDHPILTLAASKQDVQIDAGTMTAGIHKGRLDEFGPKGLNLLSHPMTIRLRLLTLAGPTEFESLPARQVEVEEPGPLHSAIRLRGGFVGANQTQTPFRYDLRIHIWAGTPRLNLLLTLTHFAPRKEPYHTAAPIIKLAGASVGLDLREPAQHIVLGSDRGEELLPSTDPVELIQPDEVHYQVNQGGRATSSGTRAAGWVALQNDRGRATIGMRYFWQNQPKAIFADAGRVGFELWAGKEPFAWEAGLAKTHELVLEFTPASANHAGSVNEFRLDPLRASMSPAWACGTNALGPLLPRGPEAISQFAYWELMREANHYAWLRSMCTGFRDFGDAYFGGPFKGKNAYTDLEYDVPYYFLLDFLRTGEVWHLNASEMQVRHQVDVDIDNFNGRIWKHSPLHTTEEAEFGHVFIRGILLHYLLTGERRSLEMACRAGDWMAPQVEKLQGMQNGRQVGWPLYCLSFLYEVTREPRYLHAAAAACGKLASGQLTTGRFNFPVRWDDRITFFNGIATDGMLTVQQLTHDEATARAVLSTARRMLGFYPEYACRTLNTFCWAAQQTNDPRYLDALQKTWRTSLDYFMNRFGSGSELHGWQFTWFAAKHQLFPLFESSPATLPDPATWKALRLKSSSLDVYLRSIKDSPAPVLLIMEGPGLGSAELLDASGKRVLSVEVSNPDRPVQPAVMVVPSGGGIHRLHLTSPGGNAWQIHHDAALRLTVYDPTGELLPSMYPKAVGFARGGATTLKLRLEVIGEGFHTGTLYDPAGSPVASVRHFVDLYDPGRYELELKTAVTRTNPPGKGWSLELSGVRVIASEGLLPYWACDENELFNPESTTP